MQIMKDVCCVLTHNGSLNGTEIPSPLPGVNTGADDDVWLDGMPIDIRNGSEMGS